MSTLTKTSGRMTAVKSAAVSVPLVIGFTMAPVHTHVEVRRAPATNHVLLYGSSVTPRFTNGFGQDYYSTKAWQSNEEAALRDLAAGDYKDFDSAEDAIAWLFDEA